MLKEPIQIELVIILKFTHQKVDFLKVDQNQKVGEKTMMIQ